MPGDLPAKEFRAAMHRVADLVADYLEQVGDYPVLPRVAPGEIAASLPEHPPLRAEDVDAILDDYKELIEPNVTHWNHPGFHAYFSITGSRPGILGEALTAALNVNSMLWQSSPAATELEERVCDWLRQMLELPPVFRGHINDTASMSTLLALAAARHAADPEIRQRGMAGRDDLAGMTLYTSDQAHSSIDKAAIVLGLGLDGVRRVASDEHFRMIPQALREAIRRDREAGLLPLMVMPTAGTTSTSSIDPLRAVAEIAREEKLWLHVDAAYGGSAAICPEIRRAMDGMEEADSIVVNPHKWMFVPLDCSLLLVRDPALLKAAFSLVPEYLKSGQQEVTNLMDLGVQLGKRFRALKLWMVIRSFGVEGLRERIREHCRLARELAGWIEADARFEVCAPVPLSLVCFRARGRFAGLTSEDEDHFNESLMRAINAEGSIMLSHTKLAGRYVLRLAIGNLKTTAEHIRSAWEGIQGAAEELAAAAGRG